MNYTKTNNIFCVYGNNNYRDYLIYNIVYEYVKTEKIKFAAVLGNAYPYYKYISDNIYIKYDENVLEDYLKNIHNMYECCNGNIDDNLLIVDSNLIDLTSEYWEYILENHEMYKINIIIILDKIMDYNIENLSKYVDIVFVLKGKSNQCEDLENLYTTFFINIYNKEKFMNLYNNCTDNLSNTMIVYLNTHDIYKCEIDVSFPKFTFNTYQIYEQKNIYEQRCGISDIINV